MSEQIVSQINDALDQVIQQAQEMKRELTGARPWREQYDNLHVGLRNLLKAAAADLKQFADAVDQAIP